MKKILLIILCLVLFGCKSNDIKQFKEEYERLNNNYIEVNIDLDNQITYLNSQEVVDFLKNDTGIILFGNETDAKTRSIIETLLLIAQDNDLDLVYYNPSTYENNKEEFAEIIGVIGNYLPINQDGEKLLRTPDVYFVDNGNLVGNFYGSVDDFNNEKLTDEQKENLYYHYNLLAKLIK